MHIQQNVSLKPFNTFGIDVIAQHLITFGNREALLEILDWVKPHHGLIVLGGGSNVLFTHDISGVVIKNEIPGIEIVAQEEKDVFIKVGAGVQWHSFVQYCLDHDFCGVENLALIPGNVGASPMQNIGAYGVELKDVFHSLNAIHIHDKHAISFSKSDCAFGYRESVFKRSLKNQYIITDVTFHLYKTPIFQTSYGAIEKELERMQITQLSIQAIAQAVMNIRISKLPDPAIIGNAGSFFKNPEVDDTTYNKLLQQFPGIVAYKTVAGYKLAAAWMIEQCGWKGFRNGDAGCHIHQPLVLVNYGNAKGSEIVQLSDDIILSVQQTFGINLEREVNIV